MSFLDGTIVSVSLRRQPKCSTNLKILNGRNFVYLHKRMFRCPFDSKKDERRFVLIHEMSFVSHFKRRCLHVKSDEEADVLSFLEEKRRVADCPRLPRCSSFGGRTTVCI